MKAVVDTMKGKQQEYQSGNYGLEDTMVTYVTCHNSLDDLAGRLEQIYVPSKLSSEKDSCIKQGEKIRSEVSISIMLLQVIVLQLFRYYL